MPLLLKFYAPMRNALLALSLLVLAARVVAGGSIEGTVELPKTKHAPVVTQRYEIVAKGGVLAPNPPVAVVYLEGNFSTTKSTQTVAQVLQKDLQFIPALLAVQVGTKVEFPNLDDTYHNVFSYSPAKRFDLGRYRSDERPIPFQILQKPGLITLRCDIHEHMRGLILVLDTPHFVTTATDGAYRFNAVPPGNYTLKAWLNSKTTFEKPVEVQDGKTVRIDLP